LGGEEPPESINFINSFVRHYGTDKYAKSFCPVASSIDEPIAETAVAEVFVGLLLISVCRVKLDSRI
jgi:hypothetical protein